MPSLWGIGWERPWALAALLAVVCFGLFLAGRASWRQRRIDRYLGEHALDRLKLEDNGRTDAQKGIVGLLALALALVALAGPRLGGGGELQPGESPSLVVALDVSQSMRAEDTSPDRFTVAKQLDETGEGVTISALAGPSDTRVYANGVTAGKVPDGEHPLTPEERQAVTDALSKSDKSVRRAARKAS